MKNFSILAITLIVACSITAYSMYKTPYQLMKTEDTVCQLSNVTTAYSGANTQKQFYVTQVCTSEKINSSQEFANKIVILN